MNVDLCIYINDLVLKEFPHYTTEQIQEKCREILTKFKSLDDITDFEELYESFFINRLSLLREKCLEYDGAIISEIRKANPQFMGQFESIKEYFTKSKELNAEFSKTKEEQKFTFNPLIFNQRFRRSFSSYKDIAPHFDIKSANNPEFINYAQSFNNFCQSKDKFRRYEIDYKLSMCDLLITIDGVEYTIRSNFYISAFLLSIIEKDMTYNELVHLHLGKKAIILLLNLGIIKKPNENNDKYHFNDKFNSQETFILIDNSNLNEFDLFEFE